jgi:citrate lyase subunit beta/citryl-CoA lyase
MPGSNARALEKARSLAADCVIFDLEDAVAPEAKGDARKQVIEAVGQGGYGWREVIIRINALQTPYGADDLAALQALPAAQSPDAVLLPKVNNAADVTAAEILPEPVALWAMMETPSAILQAAEIAAASPRLACLVMGNNDLIKDTGGRFVADRTPLHPALAITVMAARAQGLAVLDGVFNDLADTAGLAAEAEQGADFGFDGKTLTHPGQIATANRVFAPDEAEIAAAKAIVAAFDRPENTGKGVISVDGKMTELLHRDIAEKTLQIAARIKQAEAADADGGEN